MGKISPDKVQLNAVIGMDIDDVIAARAEALGLTKSKFAALVFDQWKFDGFPAFHRKVNAADSTVFDAVMKSLSDRKSRDNNQKNQNAQIPRKNPVRAAQYKNAINEAGIRASKNRPLEQTG
jgi:hypothetical protein